MKNIDITSPLGMEPKWGTTGGDEHQTQDRHQYQCNATIGLGEQATHLFQVASPQQCIDLWQECIIDGVRMSVEIDSATAAIEIRAKIAGGNEMATTH